jgi:predicted PurR-regulated permease PerM
MTQRLGRTFVLVLALAMTVAFLYLIRSFLMTVLLASVFAGVTRPIYRRIRIRVGGRDALASALTILLLLVLVIGPLTGVLGVVVAQAIDVVQSVGKQVPEIQAKLKEIEAQWQGHPIYARIQPYLGTAISKAGEAAASIGTFLLHRAQAATLGTISFIFSAFVLFYCMFYFYMDGPALLAAIQRNIPLSTSDQDQILGRFTSVTRATLKGVLFIATVQGLINGLGLLIVGIEGWVFWTMVMIVLSIVPLIGAALVWIPAMGYLVLTGHPIKALVLFLICGLVSGSVDNVLRPRLVGKDTQMHDLLIFFSTMGGLEVFGVSGFIVGPILAAVFLTVWDIFGATFRPTVAVVADVVGD